ncbi:hypothetical protein BDV97DRAFT_220631 [Delphinella strobiligena]|nr:hypothetical protein BDV97DRAFT_220631 [Delphinella strobiligena]
MVCPSTSRVRSFLLAIARVVRADHVKHKSTTKSSPMPGIEGSDDPRLTIAFGHMSETLQRIWRSSIMPWATRVR